MRVSVKRLLGIIVLVLTAFVITGRTACGEHIHEAVRNGNLAAVKKNLEEKPGEIDRLDPFGDSPAFIAIKKDDIKMLEYLVKFKPGLINAPAGQTGFTPLIIAAREGKTDIVKYLLSAGSDPRVTNNLQDTALMWAAQRRHPDVVKVLLKARSRVNHQGGLHATPLHCAAYGGDVECARILIENGADPQMLNDRGERPIDWAGIAGHKDMIKYLAQKTKLGIWDLRTLIKNENYNSLLLISIYNKQILIPFVGGIIFVALILLLVFRSMRDKYNKRDVSKV